MSGRFYSSMHTAATARGGLVGGWPGEGQEPRDHDQKQHDEGQARDDQLGFRVHGSVVKSAHRDGRQHCGGWRAGVAARQSAVVPAPTDHASLTELLARAGFLAADEEATQLLDAAAGDHDSLDAFVVRRLTGEPLAWITGKTLFCGVEVHVDPGVYVPRWLSEPLAIRAAERLPAHGCAVDLCTGSGALAKVLMTRQPSARVVAADVDARSVACAEANGVEVYRGDLFAPVPDALVGQVDVVVGVVPYVPTSELPLLQRDTFAFESALSYDGGPDGTDFLRRVLTDGRRFLRSGGALLLELGGDQDVVIGSELARLGYRDVQVLADEDGDVRGIEATYEPG
jgi:release factor glutamine methyltransferase